MVFKKELVEFIFTLILGILVIVLFWMIMPELNPEIPSDALKI